MNPVSLLCEIIAHGGKVTSDFYQDNRSFTALVRHGFLREVGAISSVVCERCGDPHSSQIVSENGSTGYYCPDLGFIPLETKELTALLPDLPVLVGRLADVFECSQRKSSSLHGLTWRVGTATTATERVSLYFHPSLVSEENVRDFQNALGREARADWRLVITSQGNFPMDKCSAVQLDDLVEIDAETGALHPIADLGTFAGVPRKNVGGRPSEHGPLISQIIEGRIKSGRALNGRNKEADAVLRLFVQRHPKEKVPSVSSVRDYVTKIRTGQ